jgi:hypothetical protein
MFSTPKLTLNLLSLNIARSQPRLASVLGRHPDYDILFLQEVPAIQHSTLPDGASPDGTGLFGFSSTPGWEAHHAPVGDISHLPRAVMYTRSRPGKVTYTYRPDLCDHPDVVVVTTKRGAHTCTLINLYNQGSSGLGLNGRLEAVMSLHVDWTLLVFLCGNFNLHHNLWRLHTLQATDTSTAAKELVAWADTLGLQLLNSKTEPTRIANRRGNSNSIIDLGWDTEDGVISDFTVRDGAVRYHSDHQAITATVTLGKGIEEEPEKGWSVGDGQKDAWCNTCKEGFLNLVYVEDLETTNSVERAAMGIFVAVKVATEKHGKQRSNNVHANQPWWTQACTDTRNAWRWAGTGRERKLAASRFRAARAKAKADHYKQFYADITPENLFRRVRTVKGRRETKVCALRSGNWHTADPKSQAELLGEAFFPPRPSQPCLTSTAFDLAQVPTRAWKPFMGEELYRALKDTSNTSAAGGSGLGYKLIKWIVGGVNCAEEAILHITNACFDLGYLPACWKRELLAVVPKPRKTDMSAPKSYRPISLIECLLKLGEKMLATRMQIDIVRENLLPNNQFGGLRHVGAPFSLTTTWSKSHKHTELHNGQHTWPNVYGQTPGHTSRGLCDPPALGARDPDIAGAGGAARSGPQAVPRLLHGF